MKNLLDNAVKYSNEYVANGDQMGLIGDTVMVKDGTQHPIKVGDEIHLLRTVSDTGKGKGLRYMYTVREGYGKLSAYRTKTKKVHILDVESDLEIDGFGSGKRKRAKKMSSNVQKTPELVGISDLPSDDEEETQTHTHKHTENISSSQGSIGIGKKGKERESDRGGGSAQSGGKDNAWDNVAGGCTCAMCHDLMVDSTNIDCGHIFCAGCLENWVGNNGKDSCPTCSKVITTMTPCLVADTIIEETVTKGKVPEDDAEEYKKRIKLAQQARKGALREIRRMAPPPQPARASRGRGRPTGAQPANNNNTSSQQRALEQSLAEQARQALELERMKAELEKHKAQAARAEREAAELKKAQAKNQGGGSSSGLHKIILT